MKLKTTVFATGNGFLTSGIRGIMEVIENQIILDSSLFAVVAMLLGEGRIRNKILQHSVALFR